MTLLELINGVVAVLKLEAVTSVVNSPDSNIKQLWQLAEFEGNHLTRRITVQEMIRSATHTALAQLDQGDIRVISDAGFERILLDTFWNQTQEWPVFGPLTEREYQEYISTDFNTTNDMYIIRNNRLLMVTAPAAGDQFVFSYLSRLWVSNEAGDAFASVFTMDNDFSLFPDDVMKLGIVWRWLKASGLDYSEEKRDYEVALKNYALHNNAKPLMLGARPSRRGDFKILGA